MNTIANLKKHHAATKTKPPVIMGIVVGRQGNGKCLKKGSLIKTPTGSKPIEDIVIGDVVYGYNSYGSVTEAKVLEVHYNGVKSVIDLHWGDRVLVSATEDHKMVVMNTRTKKLSEKSLKDMHTKDALFNVYIESSGGNINVPEAYAIGAMIGNGCCTLDGIVISETSEDVVKKVAKCFGSTSYRKLHENNYNWRLYGPFSSDLSLYCKWCEGLKAHEKFTNIEELRTWDRESQLEFLAGLFDTDGCISLKRPNQLTMSICMQSESSITAIKHLMLDLFQVEFKKGVDNRSKYKNGPVHTLKCSRNDFITRILKELPLVKEGKKYKIEYDKFKGRSYVNKNSSYFKVSESYKEHTYDITIDNDTNLYLLANGYVTHNSSTIGTLGVTTLYIHTAKETHGVVAADTMAKQCGGTIIPCSLNYEEGVTADQQLQYLFDLLKDVDLLKREGIQAVVIDSTSDLDLIIRSTSAFKKYCLTDKGTHNNFKESEAFTFLYQKAVIEPFLKLYDAGIHCLTTIAATSKDHDELGNVSSINPTLFGFNTAYEIIRSFPDILCQQKVTIEDDEGNLKTHYCFVFKTSIIKTSKDAKGTLLKMENFSPRITGCLELPEMMKSDLKTVLNLKKGK